MTMVGWVEVFKESDGDHKVGRVGMAPEPDVLCHEVLKEGFAHKL